MISALIAAVFFPVLIGWLFDKGHPDPNSIEGKRYYKVVEVME